MYLGDVEDHRGPHAFRRFEDAVQEFEIDDIESSDRVGMSFRVAEHVDGIDQSHRRSGLNGEGRAGTVPRNAPENGKPGCSQQADRRTSGSDPANQLKIHPVDFSGKNFSCIDGSV